jgi:6-phosphogluconolactonase
MGLVHTLFRVLDGAGEVTAEATRHILARAGQAVVARGRFRIALAGGTTPLAVYRHLAAAPADWLAWEVYFGDERCLPPDHRERNSLVATQALLGRVPIPQEHVFPMTAELGPEAAAAAYAPLVEAALPFDLVLLGMGEDGHTASLFPGHVIPEGALVMAVHDAPKPPPDRVSLTPVALTAAREVLILVTGASKRQALSAWRDGADLPVARVARAGQTIVLLDRAAAGALGPDDLPSDPPPSDDQPHEVKP